jgi:phosphoribosylformimino-5-aminoimidazole carboxamide ribotide isomerase
MIIYPAIDVLGKKAVRLYKGDYNKVTTYNDDPVSVAHRFKAAGADRIHLVDLDGARTGEAVNYEIFAEIKQKTGLLCEVGGGIRTIERIADYLSLGIDRVIIGTAALEKDGFVKEAVGRFGADRIAVGIDIRDGKVAVRGWIETMNTDVFDFFEKMIADGEKTFICTDISKDGAMQGANTGLYRELSERFAVDLIASGGVSTLDDVQKLAKLGIHGAIIGKALYTGDIDLGKAVKAAK